jgi:hypothetical protein
MNQKTNLNWESFIKFPYLSIRYKTELMQNAMKNTLTYRYAIVEFMNEHKTFKLYKLRCLKNKKDV